MKKWQDIRLFSFLRSMLWRRTRPFLAEKDFFKLPEDNPLCRDLGHLHLIQIEKKEDWWSGTAHCTRCFRCGWSEPGPEWS